MSKHHWVAERNPTAETAIRLTPVTDPHAATWPDFAACMEVDPEIFYPPKGGSTRAAKAVCQRCCVRLQCLDFALRHGAAFEPGNFGIWGGLSRDERQELRRGMADAA